MARYQADPVVARIERVTAQRPALAPIMELYRQWYAALDRLPPLAGAVRISEEEAARKLAQGLPVLHDCELPLHVDALQQALKNLLELVAQANSSSYPEMAEALRRLKQELPSQMPYLVQAAIPQADHWTRRRLARQYGLDEAVLVTILTMLMRPAHTIWWESVANLVLDRPWSRGYCPGCGSGPALAELQGKEGALHLRCGMCGADWAYPRLRCHRCGTRNPQTLGILQIYDDLESPFVRTCSACRDYLKVLVCYAPNPPEMLPIEDIATLELDFAAERAGFTHGIGPAFSS